MKVSGFLAPALAGALAACSTAPTHVDRDQRVVRANAAGRAVSYRFGPVPSSWEPVSIEDNDAAWHDTASNGMVHVDHSCERAQDTPLPSLVQHLLIGFTEREYDVDETVPFDGREARHVRVRAKLDGVPVVLELYVMKKDGCVFDLGFAAPQGQFDRGQSAFASFARGFHTLDTGSPATASGAEAP